MTRLSADRISGGLTLLLMAVLAIVAWLLAELTLSSRQEQVIGAPDTPKASLTAVKLERSDPTGQGLYTIRSAMGVQAQSGAILLRAPELERTVPGQTLTRITAGQADIAERQSSVALTGGVRATHTRLSEPSSPIALTTEALAISPAEERASSALPVRIEQGGRILTGTGLEMDLKTGQYKVLAAARVEIRP
jgi:LPS export ABC transporter protein LptC